MTPEFLITTIVLTATPGTGALFTIAAGLARGARAGVVAALGCTLGIVRTWSSRSAGRRCSSRPARWRSRCSPGSGWPTCSRPC